MRTKGQGVGDVEKETVLRVLDIAVISLLYLVGNLAACKYTSMVGESWVNMNLSAIGIIVVGEVGWVFLRRWINRWL